EQTVVVRVERKYRHPVYAKIVKRHKKYLAHNPSLKLIEGDLVKIKEVRPISKNKHYLVVGKK
ncbi:30S ribosomal protein S17, partial [Candidatus Roizmanbacteria bacterium RIFOXYA2_FULL_41_8]